MSETKKCMMCKQDLNVEEFGIIVHHNIYVSLSSHCKECKKIKSNQYRNTFGGFINSMLAKAKTNSKKRKNNGRIEAGEFDLTKKQLIDLYNKQNGKCYYSNIIMNVKPCCDWMCSLERLDPNKGYTIDNVALTCLEFNHWIQWSPEKIQEMIYKIGENCDYDKILDNIKKALIPKKRTIGWAGNRIISKKINNIVHWKCNSCNQYKLENEFTRIHDGCKLCYRKKQTEFLETIRGHVLYLLTNARSSTKRRQRVKTRIKNNINDEFNLTFEDAINILEKQMGLCAYSGILMNYGSSLKHNWVASLERIDPMKGYTKDNVCFVCVEFNTTDNTSTIKYSNGGSGNWSENKFLFFLQKLLDYNEIKYILPK